MSATSEPRVTGAPRCARLLLFSLGVVSLEPTQALAASGELVAFSEPLSLDAAVSTALSSGYQAQIARLEAARADDMADHTRGAYLPHLLIESQAGWSNRMNETFTSRTGTYGLANLGNDPWINVFVDQVLLDMGLLRRLERDRLAADVAEIVEDQVREGIAFEVTRLYANLSRLEALARAQREGVEHAAWLDEQASRLFDAGRAIAAEREQVAIFHEEARLTLRALELDVADARLALRVSLGAEGREPAWPRVDASTLPAAALEGAPVGTRESMAAAPDLRILELRRRMEEASVGAAKAKRLPTFQLRGGWSHYGIKRFDNFSDEAYVFVGMNIPIFDGLQAKSSIRGAQKAAEVARLRYRSGLESKRARVEQLSNQLETQGMRLVIAERRVESSTALQELADLNLRSQRGPVEAALGARERTSRDLRTAIELRFARLQRWASLQRELGRLVAALSPSVAAANGTPGAAPARAAP